MSEIEMNRTSHQEMELSTTNGMKAIASKMRGGADTARKARLVAMPWGKSARARPSPANRAVVATRPVGAVKPSYQHCLAQRGSAKHGSSMPRNDAYGVAGAISQNSYCADRKVRRHQLSTSRRYLMAVLVEEGE